MNRLRQLHLALQQKRMQEQMMNMVPAWKHGFEQMMNHSAGEVDFMNSNNGINYSNQILNYMFIYSSAFVCLILFFYIFFSSNIQILLSDLARLRYYYAIINILNVADACHEKIQTCIPTCNCTFSFKYSCKSITITTIIF